MPNGSRDPGLCGVAIVRCWWMEPVYPCRICTTSTPPSEPPPAITVRLGNTSHLKILAIWNMGGPRISIRISGFPSHFRFECEIGPSKKRSMIYGKVSVQSWVTRIHPEKGTDQSPSGPIYRPRRLFRWKDSGRWMLS
jgi:hypothetical protein